MQAGSNHPNDRLCEALGLPGGCRPFPWQEELLKRFLNGNTEDALDIPTGLGKTAVMAIWLIARCFGARLPRRLVYVVDRRAVVDQATDVALQLRKYVDQNLEAKASLGLGKRSLPISTLRGQHIDNREWLESPTLPAIIVGTVDMIGSRLLFEGYGTSRKMRPYQAGLLGADTLVVLDEAHLVPPFEELLRTIADGTLEFGPPDEALRKVVPGFRLLSLSATGRSGQRNTFGLTNADLKPGSALRVRLYAEKALTIQPLLDPTELAETLAKKAWELADTSEPPPRMIVFCNKPKDAENALQEVEKLAKGEVDTQLFVGGRRVFEREETSTWLKEYGFTGPTVPLERPAFVFATSAGEVGVDLDAHHMVSDLVAWERMVQRLGRVNRRGAVPAKVIVIPDPLEKPEKALSKDPQKRTDKESREIADYKLLSASLSAMQSLPSADGVFDASPGAIRDLKIRAESDSELKTLLTSAPTPPPLRPALSRALVDAWSMTSLEEHTGRPDITPWLRGWVDDEPQTTVIWRKHLPIRSGEAPVEQKAEKYFEAGNCERIRVTREAAQGRDRHESSRRGASCQTANFTGREEASQSLAATVAQPRRLCLRGF